MRLVPGGFATVSRPIVYHPVVVDLEVQSSTALLRATKKVVPNRMR